MEDLLDYQLVDLIVFNDKHFEAIKALVRVFFGRALIKSLAVGRR